MTSIDEATHNLHLIEMIGFKRILTSGFSKTAEAGIENIKMLVDEKTDLIIVPGSGILPSNLEKIFLETKCKEFHASARVQKEVSGEPKHISFGSSTQDSDTVFCCSKSIVQELVNILKNK